MEVHKFVCGSEHEFFLPLNLTRYITEFAPVYGKLKCPICEDEGIKMKFSPFYVIERSDWVLSGVNGKAGDLNHTYEVYFVVSDGLGRVNTFPIYKFQRETDKLLDPNELIGIIASLSGKIQALTGRGCQILNQEGYRQLCEMDASFAEAQVQTVEV